MARIVVRIRSAMSSTWPLSGRRHHASATRASATPIGSASLLLWMLAAIALVASLAFWDSARESAVTLQDFADEQSTLASAAGVAVEEKLRVIREDALVVARELVETNTPSSASADSAPRVTVRFKTDPEPSAEDQASESAETRTLQLELPFDEQRVVDVLVPIDEIVGGLRGLERSGRVLLLQRPGFVELFASDGRRVKAELIAAALERGDHALRLSRQEARDLLLPERTAMAGLSTFDAGTFGKWGVAVVSTAERQRDREARAQWRLVLSVLLASGLVLAFGGMALRKQRTELELSREIAIAEVQQQRDERLVRADKLATMGALATGIAHEVSTPLGVIMGRAEQLVPRVASDEKAARAVDAITAQTERITQIIRAFLSLARGDRPALLHLDPAEIARACTDLVEHRFDKAGVTLSRNVPPGLPNIACDPRLFEQAIVNLLLNACDACSPGGHVDLRVRADQGRVAFIVTDDGTGITPEAAARATEPFFTTKPAEQGTGLGLAIANEIVKHHQGVLTIEPREATASAHGAIAPGPRGTRACVDVPAANGANHG